MKMPYTEEELRIIDQAHRDLDRQLQDAFDKRHWGTLGVFVVLGAGRPENSGIDLRITRDRHSISKGG